MQVSLIIITIILILITWSIYIQLTRSGHCWWIDWTTLFTSWCAQRNWDCNFYFIIILYKLAYLAMGVAQVKVCSQRRSLPKTTLLEFFVLILLLYDFFSLSNRVSYLTRIICFLISSLRQIDLRNSSQAKQQLIQSRCITICKVKLGRAARIVNKTWRDTTMTGRRPSRLLHSTTKREH